MWYLIEIGEGESDRQFAAPTLSALLERMDLWGHESIANPNGGWNPDDVWPAVAKMKEKVEAAARKGPGLHQFKGTAETFAYPRWMLIVPPERSAVIDRLRTISHRFATATVAIGAAFLVWGKLEASVCFFVSSALVALFVSWPSSDEESR